MSLGTAWRAPPYAAGSSYCPLPIRGGFVIFMPRVSFFRSTMFDRKPVQATMRLSYPRRTNGTAAAVGKP
jgi:hypothetical protein